MLRRLRTGEWIALGGLLGLLATLFLRWFNAELALRCEPATAGGGPRCPYVSDDLFGAGWGALGRPWADVLVVVVIAVVVALVMALRAGPGRPTYGAVVSLVVAGAVTTLVTLLTAIRVLLARPSVELDGIDARWDVIGPVSTGVGPGAWVALASLLLILIGLWVAIADDRTDAPDSAFDPPAPRPIPAVAPTTPASAPAPPPEA